MSQSMLLWWLPLLFSAIAGPSVVWLARYLPRRMGAAPPALPLGAMALRVVWVTLLLGVLCALVMRRYPTAAGIQGMLLTALLMLISLIDATTLLIPDALVLTGVVLALLMRALGSAPNGWLTAVLGALAGATPLYIVGRVTRRNGNDALGLGDVKLMGMAGLYLGWPLIAVALVLGIVLGGIWGVFLLLLRRKSRSDALPFGPMLCMGIWIAYAYGAPMLRMYFSMMR